MAEMHAIVIANSQHAAGVRRVAPSLARRTPPAQPSGRRATGVRTPGRPGKIVKTAH